MCGQFAGFFSLETGMGQYGWDEDRRWRWGQDGDNFMDQGGDEVVSYSPCQSILRLMMLL